MRYIDINLSRGIIVDDCDLHFLNSNLFYITDSGYAAARVNGVHVYLHKLIVPHDNHVDHENTNKLDCRRDNLRKTTCAFNLLNRPKQINNTSGYKGVYKNKKRWSSRINVDGYTHHAGTFDTKEEAALNYDILAKKHGQGFAQLNFNLELT